MGNYKIHILDIYTLQTGVHNLQFQDGLQKKN